MRDYISKHAPEQSRNLKWLSLLWKALRIEQDIYRESYKTYGIIIVMSL